MVLLLLVFCRISIMISIVAALIYIPTSSVLRISFSCILTGIYTVDIHRTFQTRPPFPHREPVVKNVSTHCWTKEEIAVPEPSSYFA
jgi:hypothetical protein